MSFAAAVAAPPAPAAADSGLAYGKYDEQLWDITAKQDVYATWDPNSPRSPTNFNPFETFEGNSPDASGFYPGEGRYKDPVRPDVDFASMQAERAILEDVAANPLARVTRPDGSGDAMVRENQRSPVRRDLATDNEISSAGIVCNQRRASHGCELFKARIRELEAKVQIAYSIKDFRRLVSLAARRQICR